MAFRKLRITEDGTPERTGHSQFINAWKLDEAVGAHRGSPAAPGRRGAFLLEPPPCSVPCWAL